MFLLLSCQISRRQRVKKKRYTPPFSRLRQFIDFLLGQYSMLLFDERRKYSQGIWKESGMSWRASFRKRIPGVDKFGVGVEWRGLFFMFSRVDLEMFIILFSKPISHYYFQPIIIKSVPQTQNYNYTVAPKSQHYYLVPIQ